MPEVIASFVTGTIFGFTVGISPGPLLVLVITETIKHGKSEGIKVAISPLITDIPIIAITLFALSKLVHFDTVLGIITLLGGIFVAYLGYENIKTKELKIDIQKQKSIKRGIITNALSPHPYLFWMTVGAPITFNAYQTSLSAAFAFIASFYILLVGSKIAVALLVDRSRIFLKNKTYVWTMRTLGITLLVFAVYFIRDGLRFF